MPYSDSNAFTVAVQEGVPSTLPDWLAANPTLFRWIEIDGTKMTDMDYSALIAAGLSDQYGNSSTWGHPIRNNGIFSYSGGALRTVGSELLVFGGGGAGAWAGNDVRGLRLEDNTPVWAIRKNPNPVGATGPWPRPTTPHPYMQDGVSPNARHSYRQPQFHDGTDTFYAIGCDNVWESDSGIYDVVDSLDWSTKTWSAPGTHPNIPSHRSNDNNIVVKHPTTEKIYAAGPNSFDEFDAATNTWTRRYYFSGRSDVQYGPAAIDPVRNLLFNFHAVGSAIATHTYDMSVTPSWTWTQGTFSGPFADAPVQILWDFANAIVYCPDLLCFLMYQDDGYVYTITRGTSDADWVVDRLGLTGAGPASTGVAPKIFNRMQYVPNLKGVVLALQEESNVYFIKTGA